ncbi:rhamnulokinase family protein [Halomicroarcula sp. GCM10025324]|uniref:rhamnulokinase n=1 Tax=Haloarcula TaxID=2237 RepID=UPI0023E76D3A|nr:FGGY-family carbohydrate kinase [Halomicroarcula sp. ZS-22-S1]
MKHVAIDIGASGGTVYLGDLTPTDFDVAEVHSFDNYPVERDGRYVWDLDALRDRIVEGIRAADREAGGVDTVAIDTWGLDFGLVADGEVLRLPTSYRDPEATAERDEVFEAVGKRRLFDETGITNWATPNTLWQLYTLAAREPDLLERAEVLLPMPQLLSSLLGGRETGEVTVASTTQMVDPERRAWATDLLEALSLPTALLPDLEEPGQSLGPVADDVAASLSATPELVSTASHDTAAAVAGLPLDDDSAFLNTGSWFILGVERTEPLRTDAAFEAELSNELGVDETVRLLKNVNGFFLLEACRDAWADAGEPTDYDSLLSAAQDAPARAALVDPDADAFSIDEPMPDQIRAYCRRTDQPVPESPGAVVRCLVDSLVAKTALAFDELVSVIDDPPSRINLGGGGVRNDLFCQLLADAVDRPVVAGPVEATAIGNLLVQGVAAGTLDDVSAGRELVESTFATTTYEPTAGDDWAEAKARLRTLSAD